jgi:hypothetical protein
LQELENQVFQNEVKEQEVYHPHDTDLFDITKPDPDYHKLLPFLVSLYPIIVDSSKHCGYACTFNILTSDSPTSSYQSFLMNILSVPACLEGKTQFIMRSTMMMIIMTITLWLNFSLILTLWMNPNLLTLETMGNFTEAQL